MNMNDVFSLAYPNYYHLTFNQYKHCWDVILLIPVHLVCVCSHAHASVLLYKYMYTFMTIHVWSRGQHKCHAIYLFLETRSLAEPVICWAGQAGWPVSLSESTCLCFLSAGDYKCTLPMPDIFMWVQVLNLNLCALSIEPSLHLPPCIKSQF